MRTCWILLAILTLAGTGVASKEDSLDQLKERVDSAKMEDRPVICIEIARRQLAEADRLYTAGQVDQARADVQDVAKYAEKARDAAIDSSKKLKHTEIEVRKMTARLRDMMRSLNFEDQAPVQAVIDRLESVRTSLLTHMFGKKSS